jgi:hypothetical protein
VKKQFIYTGLILLLISSILSPLIGVAVAGSKIFTTGKIKGIIVQAPYSHSIQLVPDPLNPENEVVRFEVRNQDVWRGDAERGKLSIERAELSEPEFKAPFQTDLWYRFRVLIPEKSTKIPIRCLIAQWHATPDLHLGEVLRSPVLGIELRGTEFLIRKCHSDLQVQLNNDRTNNKTQLYKSGEFADRDVWHDFVVNVKWSWENDGYCRVWINGHKVVDYAGPIGYNDAQGPYFKTGIYRDNIPETHIVYYDGYSRGNSAAEIGLPE